MSDQASVGGDGQVSLPRRRFAETWSDAGFAAFLVVPPTGFVVVSAGGILEGFGLAGTIAFVFFGAMLSYAVVGPPAFIAGVLFWFGRRHIRSVALSITSGAVIGLVVTTAYFAIVSIHNAVLFGVVGAAAGLLFAAWFELRAFKEQQGRGG